ncbi:MAG: hypothetical protein LBR68_05615 [Lachnoclostridium sp.]|jgi:hypothetical protein|nr:hypothetical protein [Lachnoclostridium sp.]
MKGTDYWNLFYETGRIDDYLQYACTSEESQLNSAATEEADHAGKHNGYGSRVITHWRL